MAIVRSLLSAVCVLLALSSFIAADEKKQEFQSKVGYLKGSSNSVQPEDDAALDFFFKEEHQLVSRSLNLKEDDDDSMWVPLKHDNPDFPSDIVCRKKNPNQCKRLCANGRHNRVYYSYCPKIGAGLGDRLTALNHAAELAAYLCATAYVPSPARYLGRMHNSGRLVSADLVWTDFANKTLLDGTPMIHDLGREDAKKMSRRGPFYEAKDTEGQEGIWEIVTTKDNPEDIYKAIRLSMSDNPAEHVILDVQLEFYHFATPLYDSLAKLPVKSLDALGVPKAIAGKTGNSKKVYTEFSKPEWLQKAVEDMWKMLINEYPGYRYGSWHIRRGDAISQCDTSLQRMESFVECTFSEVADVKLLILVATDERSIEYQKGIEKIFETVPDTEVVWVDPKVREFMRRLPRKYNNNFHVYEISRGILAKADAFRMEHRRHQSCPDCYNMLEHLSKWN